MIHNTDVIQTIDITVPDVDIATQNIHIECSMLKKALTESWNSLSCLCATVAQGGPFVVPMPVEVEVLQ